MFYLIRTSELGEVAYRTAGGWIGLNLDLFFPDDEVLGWRPLPHSVQTPSGLVPVRPVMRERKRRARRGR